MDDKLLKKIEAYENFENGGVARFAHVSNGVNRIYNKTTQCHSDMSAIPAAAVAIVNWFPTPSPEALENYKKLLTDKETSPFREISEHIHVIEKAPREHSAVVITDLANHHRHFNTLVCKSSRIFTEHTVSGSCFSALSKLEVPAPAAYWAACLYGYTNLGLNPTSIRRHGSLFNYDDVRIWSNWCNAVTQTSDNNLGPVGGIRKCDELFQKGVSDATVKKDFRSYINNKYEVPPAVSRRSTFGGAYLEGGVTIKMLADIMKLEYKEVLDDVDR